MAARRAAFGAIRWKTDALLDDAIQMVRAFDDCHEAINCASSTCALEEQWAVVDLASMTVTARGSRAAQAPGAASGGEPAVPLASASG